MIAQSSNEDNKLVIISIVILFSLAMATTITRELLYIKCIFHYHYMYKVQQIYIIIMAIIVSDMLWNFNYLEWSLHLRKPLHRHSDLWPVLDLYTVPAIRVQNN